MLTLIACGLFTEMLMSYMPKWKKAKEERDWQKWNEYEDLREEMDVSCNIVRMPKKYRKKINPRKKHAV